VIRIHPIRVKPGEHIGLNLELFGCQSKGQKALPLQPPDNRDPTQIQIVIMGMLTIFVYMLN